jgi:hypothetical protein
MKKGLLIGSEALRLETDVTSSLATGGSADVDPARRPSPERGRELAEAPIERERLST